MLLAVQLRLHLRSLLSSAQCRCAAALSLTGLPSFLIAALPAPSAHCILPCSSAWFLCSSLFHNAQSHHASSHLVYSVHTARRAYPAMLACLQQLLAGVDAAVGSDGHVDVDIEHELLVATNMLITTGFLQLPHGFLDAQALARDVSFLMGAASRFICEPWRWFAHLYLPFLTQVCASRYELGGLYWGVHVADWVHACLHPSMHA